MTDWIEEKTAQAEAQKNSGLTRRAQGLEVMDQLETVVRRDIEKWNGLNPGYRRKIDGAFKSMPSGGFQVRKTSFPPATVDVILSPDAMFIEAQSTTLDEGNKPHTARGRFDLRPGTNGRLSMTTELGGAISFEKASQTLLDPLTKF